MPDPSSLLTLPSPPEVRARTASHAYGWQRAAQQGLIGVATFYLAIVLFAPLAAMGAELTRIDLGKALRSLFEPEALAALRMSLVLTVLSVSINAVVGVILALAIVRQRFALRGVVNALADLPLAVSPVMVGLAFLLLFGNGGWFAKPLASLDVKVAFGFAGLLLGTLFVALPFTVREIVYVLEELGTSEEEAAATLGASPAQIFLRVTLPNIRFALGYGMLMTMARSMGEFGAVLVLGGSISGQTQTATTFIHDAIEERDTGSAYGMAVLLALFSVILLLALEWAKQRRKVTR